MKKYLFILLMMFSITCYSQQNRWQICNHVDSIRQIENIRDDWHTCLINDKEIKIIYRYDDVEYDSIVDYDTEVMVRFIHYNYLETCIINCKIYVEPCTSINKTFTILTIQKNSISDLMNRLKKANSFTVKFFDKVINKYHAVNFCLVGFEKVDI